VRVPSLWAGRLGSYRVDAREQLRTAHDMLAAMGAAGFAERAARELLATSETARQLTVETGSGLTAQEAQIARLARDGLSKPEIGVRLFISPRTVEYHLHKVFGKLDISSRTELGGALPGEPSARCRSNPTSAELGWVSASAREPPRPGGRCCYRSRTLCPAPRWRPYAGRARRASGCRSLHRTGRRARRPSCQG
jgi:DNA-binding CsgD family transcriptional regulator